MFSLFQTERTSPFCARKCFRLGAGARVILTCSDSEGSSKNPGWRVTFPGQSPPLPQGMGPKGVGLLLGSPIARVSLISGPKTGSPSSEEPCTVREVPSREGWESQQSTVRNGLAPPELIPSGSEWWLSLPALLQALGLLAPVLWI